MTVYEGEGAHDEQVYETPAELADALVALARTHAHPGSGFVEFGVGDGVIYRRLPQPRCGVEVRPAHHVDAGGGPLEGVDYGTDGLGWVPRALEPNRPLCVVCNPPFAKQAAVFNHAAAHFGVDDAGSATAPLRVAWLVGVNMRLWTNEDQLDARMRLVHEALVPPTMSRFRVARRGESSSVAVQTVLQVWERMPRGWARPAWGLPRRLPGLRPVYAEPCPDGALAVARVANVKQLGKAGVLGVDAHCDRPRHLALLDARPPATCTLGTLRRGHGTAMVLAPETAAATAEAQRVAARLAHLQRAGIIHDLFRHRTCFTFAALSAPVIARLCDPTLDDDGVVAALARPVAYLDGVARHPRQW